MLKDLRRKFVIIIMALVSVVLVSVLGSSYVSAWQTQHDFLYKALDRSIEGGLYDLPRIAITDKKDPKEDDGARGANILVLAVDLDESGVVIATNQAPFYIDPTTLANILDTALESDKDSDWDDQLHLAWKRAQRTDVAWRVVIADTSSVDLSLQRLAVEDLVIVVVAAVVLLLISIGLATWVLKPVEAAWEQQRRFVADASHELKTPLAVISANTQILVKDPNIPDESMRWIQSTADETTHMKNLVEELLELARTDETSSGATGVMQRTDIDFSSMVENAALEFDAIAFERGTSIEESIEEDVHVQGDPEWLERLCKILIDNATKYTEGSTPVIVSLASDSRHCTLKVTNFGNVIDPQDLQHIFDRFYRTDKARSRNNKTGGFGLGLAIAKGIATSHGGDITATSSAEKGTTFCVTLPATRAKSHE
jgi:signal transduction histidine kinase